MVYVRTMAPNNTLPIVNALRALTGYGQYELPARHNPVLQKPTPPNMRPQKRGAAPQTSMKPPLPRTSYKNQSISHGNLRKYYNDVAGSYRNPSKFLQSVIHSRKWDNIPDHRSNQNVLHATRNTQNYNSVTEHQAKFMNHIPTTSHGGCHSAVYQQDLRRGTNNSSAIHKDPHVPYKLPPKAAKAWENGGTFIVKDNKLNMLKRSVSVAKKIAKW